MTEKEEERANNLRANENANVHTGENYSTSLHSGFAKHSGLGRARERARERGRKGR